MNQIKTCRWKFVSCIIFFLQYFLLSYWLVYFRGYFYEGSEFICLLSIGVFALVLYLFLHPRVAHYDFRDHTLWTFSLIRVSLLMVLCFFVLSLILFYFPPRGFEVVDHGLGVGDIVLLITFLGGMVICLVFLLLFLLIKVLVGFDFTYVMDGINVVREIVFFLNSFLYAIIINYIFVGKSNRLSEKRRLISIDFISKK